ncbi:hypothetical protein [Streptomyces sp. ISL-100]|uniref:hypothetical protein n=1 Tax=Streptomyces sp. ISL-100 TaxID=2819173 RepID=UPI001BE71B6F|nr:hypothetical protein [Streptomyces sp. ISL-100]MBT2399172.1 hypothetical protein [Streptomyces sp. ISL-100]
MSMVMEQTLAAPDLLKLTLYFLPEWLRITLGAATLLVLLVVGTRRLWRILAARRIRPERPAD